MALVGQIAAIPVAASEGSFLVSPGLGLMIWTLIVFLFTMWVLSKVAFPRIQEALDTREDDRRLDRHRRTAAQGIGRTARGVPRPAGRGARAGGRDHGPGP